MRLDEAPTPLPNVQLTGERSLEPIVRALRRFGIGGREPLCPAPEAPLFTIVIPTCDRPDALARALQSVRQQSDARWTVIIVDDGRTPVALPEVYAARPELQLIRTRGRIGAPAARNLGMASAKTPWIVFLDDDDELLPDFLKNLAARVQGRDGRAVLAITDLVVFDYDRAGTLLRERLKTFRSAQTPLGHDIHQSLRAGMSGLAINRLALQQAGPMDPSYRVMDDSEWILRLIQTGSQIVFVAPPGVRVHSDASLDRLSDSDYFAERIAECQRAKDRYQTLDGRFPGLGALFDAIIAGLAQQAHPAKTGEPASA
jgi:GT2 family glycosyltransferase